jgi:hypothetical protein
MSYVDVVRMDWLERNPERVYQSAMKTWWIRPLREDGSVEYNTHPTAAGAPRAIGPFPTLRTAVDDARRERREA